MDMQNLLVSLEVKSKSNRVFWLTNEKINTTPHNM